MSITLGTETINRFFEKNREVLLRIAARISGGSPLVGPVTLMNTAYEDLRTKRPRINDEHHLKNLLIRMFVNRKVDIIRRDAKTVPLEAAPIQKIPTLGLETDVRDALHALQTSNRRAAEVVRLHYFEGWTRSEIAEHFGVHLNTVKSDLRAAYAWIHNRLSGTGSREKVQP